MSTFATAALCGVLSLSTPAPAAGLVAAAEVTAQPEARPYASIVDKVAPAMVTVKFVMAIDGEDDSEEEEIDGLVIDPEGIVLVSSAMMFGPEYLGVSLRPREIKIILPGETEGLDAEVVVRDRELDLAWLRITAPTEEPRKLPSISFKNDTKPTLGQPLVQVWKLDKFYDRAPYVSEGRVASIVSKPRDLFIAGGEITIGLPVFDLNGNAMGFGILQLPDEDEMSAMASSNPYTRAIFTRTMLPAAKVASATETALATIEDDGD